MHNNGNLIYVPKYPCGAWSLFQTALCYNRHIAMDKYPDELFRRCTDPSEEILFKSQFRRPVSSRDGGTITIQDIKDVVLFLAKPKRFPVILIDMLHTETIDVFLNDSIIYFEYFLKLLEFMVIRRDEMRHPKWKSRSVDSDCVEHMMSEYMTQYRIILGRSYSKILLGQGDMRRFHHMANGMHQSYSEKDRCVTEPFFAFCKQCIWIAHHRRAQNEIDFEFDRLFRSAYFQLDKKATTICHSLTPHERHLLYGINDRRMQMFRQQPPLVMELLRMHPRHYSLLWLTDRKYEGRDSRMQKLELEYTVPDAQLVLVNVQHGILGHPMHLYSTLPLSLSYCLIRQPYLRIPNWGEVTTTNQQEHHPPVYEFIGRKYDFILAERQRRIWRKKECLMKRVGDVRLVRDIYKEVQAAIKWRLLGFFCLDEYSCSLRLAVGFVVQLLYCLFVFLLGNSQYAVVGCWCCGWIIFIRHLKFRYFSLVERTSWKTSMGTFRPLKWISSNSQYI